VIRAPAGQKSAGRRSSRSSPNQWPTTVRAGTLVTVIPRSTAGRSVMGWSNRSEMIMPVPTVDRSSGLK
jgi:hypothetical protein